LLDVDVVSLSSSDPGWFVDFEDNPTNYFAWRRQVGEALSGLADTVPPVRTEGWPSGSLPNGTTSYVISLQTWEDATCKYATTPGVSYNGMPYFFTMRTGGIIHTTQVTGLQEANTYYVRCQDLSSNVNTDDYLIQFTTIPSGVTVEVDSTYPSAASDKDVLVNGALDSLTAFETWASCDQGDCGNPGPHWVVINFSSPTNVSNVTLWWAQNMFVVSEYFASSQQVDVQYWDSASYQTLGTIGGDYLTNSFLGFTPVETTSLRFWQPANMGPIDYMSIMWLTEIEWGEGSSGCVLAYDEPICGCIDNTDLAEAITGWFGSSIDISELLLHIKDWKSCGS